MKPYISPQLQQFMTPGADEEALDQPIYHYQSYAQAGTTQLNFFGTSIASATNGLSDTNMDAQNVLSAGKRFAVRAISVVFLSGSNPVQKGTSTTLASAANDAKLVLEGVGYLELKILDKPYLQEAPLIRVPGGVGLSMGAGGIQQTQASAADGLQQVSYGTNGMPVFENKRKLLVPLPLPQQVRFSVSLNWPTVIAVSAAARIGVVLDGMLIRARQ